MEEGEMQTEYLGLTAGLELKATMSGRHAAFPSSQMANGFPGSSATWPHSLRGNVRRRETTGAPESPDQLALLGNCVPGTV